MLEAVTELGRAIASTRRAPFGGRGLTRSQLETLFLLAHRTPPMTPARLAAALGITRGAVTQLLQPLRAERLVETFPNPEDARSQVIALSPAAASEVERFESSVVEHFLPRFAALDDDELAQLAQLLRAITAAPPSAAGPSAAAPNAASGRR